MTHEDQVRTRHLLIGVLVSKDPARISHHMPRLVTSEASRSEWLARYTMGAYAEARRDEAFQTFLRKTMP